MAETLGCSEAEVLERLRRLEADGALSRVGPVLRHQRAGASTLAALAVPEERLQRVAERISQYAEVNHNYQREHRYNLWFVLTAGDRAQLDRVLAEIAADTGLQPSTCRCRKPTASTSRFPWRPADEPRRTLAAPQRQHLRYLLEQACRWPAGPTGCSPNASAPAKTKCWNRSAAGTKTACSAASG